MYCNTYFAQLDIACVIYDKFEFLAFKIKNIHFIWSDYRMLSFIKKKPKNMSEDISHCSLFSTHVEK